MQRRPGEYTIGAISKNGTMIEERISHYRIMEKLGQGEMGEAYCHGH